MDETETGDLRVTFFCGWYFFFRTASEIHGRLKVVGNIEKLMPTNKFGLLLQKNGFEQTKYRGTRGYVVVENSTPSQNQKDIAQELLSQDVY